MAELNLQQPKAQDAAIVEAAGLTVPRRFPDIGAALESAWTIPVIFRSEHPAELDRISGFSGSPIIDPESMSRAQQAVDEKSDIDQNRLTSDIKMWSNRFTQGACGQADVINFFHQTLLNPTLTDDERMEGLLAFDRNSLGDMYRYARLMGRDVDEFLGDMSISFWEYIEGANVTIVEDDVVEGRYTIMYSTQPEDGGMQQTGGAIVDSKGRPVSSDEEFFIPPDKVVEAINFSHQAKAALSEAGVGSSENCSMFELQIDPQGKIYYLQIRFGRDRHEGRVDTIGNDFHVSEGWHEAKLVRGATDGVQTLARVSMYYPSEYLVASDPSLIVPEDGSIHSLQGNVMSLVLHERGRKAFMQTTRHSPDVFLGNLATGHMGRSNWFGPQVAMLLPQEFRAKYIDGQKLAAKEKKVGQVAMQVVSDGTNGYARVHNDV